jgi:DeoR family fructose operon transcriptional repressor
LFGEERKNKIIEILNQDERVDVIELGKLFEVSESTIRRDLKELEESNLLKRTHGGAVTVKIAARQNVNVEPSFLEKEIQFQKEKKAIAKKAIQFINNGDTILLDSGTTTFYILQELKVFTHLTVVTNAVISPEFLNHHAGIDIIFLGGSFRSQTQSMVGMFTEQCLNMIRVDKCFIATNAIDHRLGLTTPNMAEAEIKRKMIACSREVLLVADSSKFGNSSFAKFADMDKIDICITDINIREEDRKSLSSAGITVVIAEADRNE